MQLSGETPRRIQHLLNAGHAADQEIEQFLVPAGFHDWRTAWGRLRGLCETDRHCDALSACLPMLLSSLQDAATPDASVMNFERFAQTVPDSVELFRFLASNPRAVEILVKLFVNSQFLTRTLLRHPEYLERLTNHRRIAEFKSREDFLADAAQAMATVSITAPPGHDTTAPRLDGLRRFQHWELLRIGACDSFGLMDLKTVTLQLSLLADATVRSVLRVSADECRISVDDFVVLAFGKLGGEELNYSSDIDLVFITRGDPAPYWPLGQRLIGGLMDATSEGFLYRVDMRLRPWGKSGPLVTSVDAYLDYLRHHAAAWERQALLKARPIAGQMAIGREFLQRAEELMFAGTPEQIRLSVSTMKGRIEARLKSSGRMFSEVKLGEGSIRDIEFVTQYLQLVHGREERYARSINTLDGLVRLAELDRLQANEYQQLSTAYIVMRKIEHTLQLLHYRQVHELPSDSRELTWLARRLDFPDAEVFLDRYGQHRAEVRAIFLKYIENTGSGPGVWSVTDGETAAEPSPPHAAAMEPSYQRIFTGDEIRQHASLLRELAPSHPVRIDAVRLQEQPGREVHYRVTVCGYDLPGDLALMCGVLFASGINIVNGNVFTADDIPLLPVHTDDTAPRRSRPNKAATTRWMTRSDSAAGTDQEPVQSLAARRSPFINVFVVSSVRDDIDAEFWSECERELCELVTLAAGGQLREAQGQLARRVASALKEPAGSSAAVRPIDITVDNKHSATHTVLQISAEDSPGFLYELASALTLLGVDIHRVTLTSLGNRVVDTLHIAGPDGGRVTDPAQQARLRAAVVLVKHFTHLLPQSPNPAAALARFREFLERILAQPGWDQELATLDRSEVLETLARLLGVSDFLWEDLLRRQHDNLFPILRDTERLARRRDVSELSGELQTLLSAAPAGAADAQVFQHRVDVLNAFKDRESFRVDLRHISGRIFEFGEFSAELTDVVDITIGAALGLCFEEVARRCGLENLVNGVVPLVVLALGKAGGRELGFASDIELMFVYDDAAADTIRPRRHSVTVAEFCTQVVAMFPQVIQSRREGIFQIDLRLRPYGNAGPLAVSRGAFRSYFAPGGPAWPYERQALVKLRSVAGDLSLGARLLQDRDELVFTGEAFDVSAMRAMRERQIRQHVRPGIWNAKLSAGGLVDCEYLVQGLQITHGSGYPDVRDSNTCGALRAITHHGLLEPADGRRLEQCYIFLRRLIDALRMVRGDARDLAVPDWQSAEFEFLARRLGGYSDTARLRHDIEATAATVIELTAPLDQFAARTISESQPPQTPQC